VNLENNQSRPIRQYLLGLAPEAESSALDERLVTDGDFYEELLIVESELIDEYLADELSASERKAFENHFLISPERQKQLQFAKSFHSYLSEKATELDQEPALEEVSAKPTDVPKPPPKPWYSSFLPVQSPVVAYAMMAAMLLIVAGVSWWMIRGRASESGAIYAVTLTAGTTRGADDRRNKINVPPGTDMVELKLPLRNEDYTSYRTVLLSGDGPELWRAENLQSKSESGNKFILADVPARLLVPGDYSLRLSGKDSSGKFEDLPTYRFQVLR
jgi:hypothetical protein